MSKNTVFIGGGNMAEGIFRNMLNHGWNSDEIIVNELQKKRCAYITETYGIKAAPANDDAVKNADLVIFALLPRILPAVAANTAELIAPNAVILSIAAGVTIETIESAVGSDRKIARVMPNTLGLTGHGCSAVCFNKNMSEDDKALVLSVLESIGKPLVLSEDKFSAFTGFGCTGPLWLYKMADAMVNAGVYSGFSRADATDMVLENMLGVASMLQMTGKTPGDMVNAMCSPGGVTIEGFKSLQEEGFDAAVMTSIVKAVKKAGEV